MQEQEGVQIDEDSKQSVSRWNILFYETFGTALLVYGSVASLYKYIFLQQLTINSGSDYSITFCYLGVLLLFARISGGHFNPAVSFTMAAQQEIALDQLFVYIIAQFVGAFLGAVLAYLLLDMSYSPYNQIDPFHQLAGSLFGEIFGSTIFLIFILIQFVKDTRFASNQIIAYLFLALSFYGAREFSITTSRSLFNPAAATSLSIFNCIYMGSWDQIGNIWIFIGGPLGGSLFAKLFYSFVYTQQIQRK